MLLLTKAKQHCAHCSDVAADRSRDCAMQLLYVAEIGW